MLTEICAEVRNYFIVKIYEGEFTISDGQLTPSDFLQENQYFRIIGSVFNDGVHQFSTSELTDETFSGSIWAMAVPLDFIALAAKIKEYNQSDASKPTPYTSESFGGYSYSKATDKNGVPMNSWRKVFAPELNRYRRMSVL